jgi:alkylation response protein AidB-like acyl-CoA dehydrogenase
MNTELQDSARKVLSGLGVPADGEQTWHHIVELGWLLVAVPEELGGLGEGLAGAGALYRELGSSLAAAPFLPAMLAIDALSQAGEESWIERVAAGAYVSAAHRLLKPPCRQHRTVG